MLCSIDYEVSCAAPLQRVSELGNLRGNPAQRERLQAVHTADLLHRRSRDRETESTDDEDNHVFPRRFRRRLQSRFRPSSQTAPTLAAPKMYSTRFSMA